MVRGKLVFVLRRDESMLGRLQDSVDDGSAEYGLRSAGDHLAWLNQFTVTTRVR